MTKREMIDEILLLNRSAQPEFLAQFETDELDEYLRHLQMIRTPRLNCMRGQYDRYFENLPAVPSGRPNPAATIVSTGDEAELWPQDEIVDEDVPTEQLLFEDFDDDLEDVGREHVSLFNGSSAQVSHGHK